MPRTSHANPSLASFVLGAGLGTRLRPLSENCPKPLVPLFGKPLITYALDHLRAELDVEEFWINTHHAAREFSKTFPTDSYGEAPIHWSEEPVLLDTGGGLAQIAPQLSRETLIVYNGDILTDLPLQPLLETHRCSGHPVTLALRSRGPNPNVGWDPASSAVCDLRGALGATAPQSAQFTGIYLLEKSFWESLPPATSPYSIVDIWLDMLRAGQPLGGALLDEGEWMEVGSVEAYTQAHHFLARGKFPRYAPRPQPPKPVNPSAHIDPTAELTGISWAGAGSRLGAHARLENSIVWAGGEVAPSVHLRNCIVRTGQKATQSASDTIF